MHPLLIPPSPPPTFPRRALFPLLLSPLFPNPAHSNSSSKIPALLSNILTNSRPYLNHLIPITPTHNLWRGTSLPPTAWRLNKNPTPDLLCPSTYGPEGAAYFRAFDALPIGIRARRAHIATGAAHVAAEWGTPAVIFPMGHIRFAFLEERHVFFEEGESLQHALQTRGPVVVGQRLRHALEEGREVMFESEGWIEVGELLVPHLMRQLQNSLPTT